MSRKTMLISMLITFIICVIVIIVCSNSSVEQLNKVDNKYNTTVNTRIRRGR